MAVVMAVGVVVTVMAVMAVAVVVAVVVVATVDVGHTPWVLAAQQALLSRSKQTACRACSLF